MAEQKEPDKRGRSLSRQILGNDLDLVNKYATKYNAPAVHGRMKRTQTYSAVPSYGSSFPSLNGGGGG
eukprot:CAMPEP_0197056984 /NCGR_PEP_ID=MMETSP1384-20130603/91901_1 /TAXON_ID=29189 /ORGANISM="Ammonia sp." /LENGTH=67 /DNA_ID=CAMNT_0042491203 /DNA_START=16 /DNA_END=215 /DNA_ORIENTATION=+